MPAADRDCRNAGADQQATAGAVDDLERARIADEATGAACDQRVAEGIGEGEDEERRLEHQHLRQEVGMRIEEGRKATKKVMLLGLSAVTSQA